MFQLAKSNNFTQDVNKLSQDVQNLVSYSIYLPYALQS